MGTVKYYWMATIALADGRMSHYAGPATVVPGKSTRSEVVKQVHEYIRGVRGSEDYVTTFFSLEPEEFPQP